MRSEHEDSQETHKKYSLSPVDFSNACGFLLECMRQGRVDLIQNHYSDEQKRAFCDQMFGKDRAYALRTCMILWVDAIKVAQNAGVPHAVADAIYAKCISRSHEASTPWMITVVSERYLVELAEAIIDGQKFYNSPIFIRFQKYIRDHISDNLSIDKVADALNISKSHLSHTIKKESGDTVHNWIIKEKINAAKIMLSDGNYNMNQIWNLLGFCSQSHFAKCFRQAAGLTPSQFRADLLK